jgi:hypothetical protein
MLRRGLNVLIVLIGSGGLLRYRAGPVIRLLYVEGSHLPPRLLFFLVTSFVLNSVIPMEYGSVNELPKLLW